MKENKTLTGGQLSGGNSATKRAENDFYATDPRAVEMLLEVEKFYGKMLEPCVGEGHIAEVLKDKSDISDLICMDIVDRGYDNTNVQDFLKLETDEEFDSIVTNPPYSLASDFAEKGLSLLSNGGRMALFLKLQFLEGAKRKEFFEKYPPKYIYVFRNRMATWKLGSPINPETGKKWAETICFAWFIWEKGSTSEPIVRWL